MNCFFLVVLLLSGCAGIPPFQNMSNGVGYQVREISSPDAFVIHATLPESAGKEYAFDYSLRAGMETCFSRSFSFADMSVGRIVSNAAKTIQVENDFYCYKENRRRALGVTFKDASKNSFGASVSIDHTNNKPDPMVMKDDLVVAVNGTPVTTIDEIKKIVFLNENKSVIPMTIVREGKKITVNEPIVVFIGSQFNQEDLNNIRKKVK